MLFQTEKQDGLITREMAWPLLAFMVVGPTSLALAMLLSPVLMGAWAGWVAAQK